VKSFKKEMGWDSQKPLLEGVSSTYKWIEEKVNEKR